MHLKISQKQPPDVFYKKVFLKISLKSVLLRPATLLKRDSNTGFSVNFERNFPERIFGFCDELRILVFDLVIYLFFKNISSFFFSFSL